MIWRFFGLFGLMLLWWVVCGAVLIAGITAAVTWHWLWGLLAFVVVFVLQYPPVKWATDKGIDWITDAPIGGDE